MVHDVSQAIMFPAAQEEIERIEKKWFGDPGACESKSSAIGSSSLGFRSFSGLFVISGTVSGLVLLIHLVIITYHERGKLLAASLHQWLQCVNFFLGAKDWRLPIFKGRCINSSRNGNDADQPHGATAEGTAMHDFTSEL